MAGPHKPWAGEVHSAALPARVRRLLTLKETHEETVALGTPLSVSAISRMEREGTGSDLAWETLAQVLSEPVDRIRPASLASENSAAFPSGLQLSFDWRS